MSNLSYEKSGVNIDVADKTKKEMSKALETNNPNVLNKLGAFASLYNFNFPEIKEPVLVLKTEEPGSKQKLAFQYDKFESICADMINHLVNDIIVMGAQPLTVQDAIICGKINQEHINRMVKGIADACKENGCVLTGGETSEQPGVVEEGVYILTSSVVGVVDKENIIDGSKIKIGDNVLAIASNGIHTNGYSLLRLLMKNNPNIINEEIEGEKFIDIILKPHRPYYPAFKEMVKLDGLKGMAHITGGGIKGNLNRILPDNLNAEIDLEKIQVLPIFNFIQKEGNIEDNEMLKTFNMGVGMTIIVDKEKTDTFINHLSKYDMNAYSIGEIITGNKEVIYKNKLKIKKI